MFYFSPAIRLSSGYRRNNGPNETFETVCRSVLLIFIRLDSGRRLELRPAPWQSVRLGASRVHLLVRQQVMVPLPAVEAPSSRVRHDLHVERSRYVAS